MDQSPHNRPEFTVALNEKKPQLKAQKELKATSDGSILQMGPLRPTEVHGSLSFCSKREKFALQFLLAPVHACSVSVGL